MTNTEHLLTILAEECVEVAQRCTKALRFGLNETQPGHAQDNAARIMDELVDVRVVLLLLQEQGALPEADCSQETMDRKRAKVLKYMAYAQECGTLNKAEHLRA